MLEEAQAGSVSAATWIGNYVLGKPKERVELSNAEPDRYELVLPNGINDSESSNADD
jgi:hypothetical protein